MLNAVLDSTVLVSAFLTEKGISGRLLRYAREEAFTLCLSDEILEETARVLLRYKRIRQRYEYTDDKVLQFVQGLRVLTRLSTNPPAIKGVSRDPNDDMVIACALATDSSYLVTRDDDLLTLGTYQQVTMLPPEEFIHLLREQRPGP